MNIKILYKPKQFVHRLIWFVEFKSLQRNLFFGKQIETLKLMKDKHIGKRCFIIGNGPSLAKTDLSKLENEFTFGLNRIYLLFDELRFSTSYYVCVNRLILTQFGDEIETKVNSPKFTFWENYDLAKNISNMCQMAYFLVFIHLAWC